MYNCSVVAFFLRIVRSQLVAGSVLTLGSSIILNALNYLYTIAMGRILGHEPFGVLSAAFALFLLFVSAPTAAITLTVTKWSATHERTAQLKILAMQLYEKVMYGLIGLTTLLVISHLAIGIPTGQTLIFVAGTAPLYFFLAINTGILSGLRKFTWLAVLAIVMGITKLTSALMFVFVLHFDVAGGLAAITLSTVIPLLLSLVPLRSVAYAKEVQGSVNWGSLIEYLGPVFIVTLAASAFTTLDILAVKWFLPGETVGLYAAVMSTSRLIFFAISPIASVLFPLVVVRREHKAPFAHLFLFTLVVTLCAAGVALAAFHVVPSLLTGLLYGVKYPHAAQYLFLGGVVTSLYTLVWLFMTYLLSLHITRFIFWPFLAMVAETLLLFFFHNSIAQIMQVNGFVLGALLVTLTYFVLRSARI